MRENPGSDRARRRPATAGNEGDLTQIKFSQSPFRQTEASIICREITRYQRSNTPKARDHVGKAGMKPSTRANSKIGADQSLKIEIAACVRLLNMEDLLTYNGHVSARIPWREDAFVIHSIDAARGSVGPEHMVTLDLDGTVIEAGTDMEPPSEFYIHSEIYRARPDVNAVAHLHGEYAIAFTLVNGAPLLLVRCDSIRWKSGIPTHPDPTRIKTVEQGRQLVGTLSNHDAVLLRAHGSVVVAPDLRGVFASSIQFEENARAQVLAATLGQVTPLNDAEIEAQSSGSSPAFMKHYDAKIWRYYVQKGLAEGLLPEAWSSHLI